MKLTIYRTRTPNDGVPSGGYDRTEWGKSLLLHDGGEVFWNCGVAWTEPNHAQVMDSLKLTEGDVREYRRWYPGGALGETRSELVPAADRWQEAMPR